MTMSHPGEYPHLSRIGRSGVEFNETATEITIFDRRGHLVWKKQRSESLQPIRWEGLDLHGEHVNIGGYTCKIVYPDGRVVYIPFVFMR